jgi:diketogulonate reductase-like aldo/keto reductase
MGNEEHRVMWTKELGRTGVRIPEIGFGTWNYSGGAGPIRKAFDLGACLIDTAEYYGNEDLVGEAIRGIRDRVFLATKVSPDHFSRSALLRSADESLRRLRIDSIDLYQLHWPSRTVPIEETMEAMEELVDRGKVRFIGVSNFSLRQLKRAQAAQRRHRIVSNQMRYNLIDRSIEQQLLAHCRADGISVIAYSPLARGIPNILARDPRGVLRQIAGVTGKTPAQVALNWCVSQDGVIAIPKANAVERVEENCRASGWRLSSEHLRMLREGIRFERRGPLEAALRGLAWNILRRVRLR